eukprot:CAMPEP_0170148948 /NCGR_PEP_ID=MMETSP0033_2-20121228/40990_1 /TAXON_ID=195969 /ORGANISM="Dolichomastix tenuilepis, Strain CCMP3274" /LENGTH=184 /DNA_ID=CAMNT_0010385869 /DNA_START=28 /DNA_END=578 /DNA_ORIENTATION=-
MNVEITHQSSVEPLSAGLGKGGGAEGGGGEEGDAGDGVHLARALEARRGGGGAARGARAEGGAARGDGGAHLVRREPPVARHLVEALRARGTAAGAARAGPAQAVVLVGPQHRHKVFAAARGALAHGVHVAAGSIRVAPHGHRFPTRQRQSRHSETPSTLSSRVRVRGRPALHKTAAVVVDKAV